MKVLIASSFAGSVGGVQSHVDTLRSALGRAGVESILVARSSITLADLADLADMVKAMLMAGGRIDVGRAKFAEQATVRLRRKIERVARAPATRPDLLHAHDALITADEVQPRLPTVLTVHGPLSREVALAAEGGLPRPRYVAYIRKAEIRAYRAADALIAVDSGQKAIIVEDFGIPESKVTIVPNAVDTDIFSPRAVPPAAVPYLLVARRLVPKTGVHVAIRALALATSFQGELWIAGDGQERPGLQRLTRELGLEGRVRFLGTVGRAAMIDLIAGSRGSIIPSVPVGGVVEATSIAALEAMSMARPVWASRIGGLADIISHGQNGFLFPAGDARSLADLLDRTAGDPALLAAIGGAARTHALEHHGTAAWAAQTLEVYEAALGSFRPALRT